MYLFKSKALSLALIAMPAISMAQFATPPQQDTTAQNLGKAATANVTLGDYVAAQRASLAVEVAKANAAASTAMGTNQPKVVVKKETPPPPSEPSLNGAMVGRDGRFVAEISYEGRAYLTRVNERVGSSPWVLTKGSGDPKGIDVVVSKVEMAPVKNKKTGRVTNEQVTVTRYFHIDPK